MVSKIRGKDRGRSHPDMVATVSKGDGYSLLKDLKLEIGEEGAFSLCFWVYLMTPISLPATIIRQMHSDVAYNVPFLVINGRKKMTLMPLLFLHKEAPNSNKSTSWMESPYASADTEFPLKKWVHVGCEVSNDFVRLHIDGEIVGEKHLSSYMYGKYHSNGLRGVTLTSVDGIDDGIHGYIHNVEVLPITSSIKDHHLKDPPLQLSIDNSCASEIEEGCDGVWNIVGGKASCRRNFSLDVVLLDALNQPVNKEMEVVASLLYADNGELVDKPNDEEASLLTSYDGIEFASCDRPSTLFRGRASFKLKISQLSSKCESRLFRIRFDIPKIGRYPFLEAFSVPIRCVSRNRNTRPFSMWKKSSFDVQPSNGSQSSGLDDESLEFQTNIIHELKPSLPSKRIRLEEEKSCATFRAGPTFEQHEEECNSHACTASQHALGTNLAGRLQNVDAAENSSSDSESTEENLSLKSSSSGQNPISDLVIFKYCLGSSIERTLLLKEIATSASDQELLEFAQQVSLYSGCSHHRCQIVIAKRLIEEGAKFWNLISQNNHCVHWDNVTFEIEEQFMRIACCSTRSLSQQDFELLRKIAGCQEFLARENFDKMWHWLYPVAYTISQGWINTLWSSIVPKWIEGFITKEEAESSLQGPMRLQEPGTFALRFPTSRSWPHPDAGSIIVTYVGSDYALHHRLLSLDFMHSSGEREMNLKPLQDMLLADPELSRLGRIIRSH
ncbi:SH2 domain-containing protein A-like isoform X2 [Malania oleifera]|uniref:SH2 domain-containing protein A-like isoform X2 n=1 Tax=Malania oleifera TaxID=397392 RepID=UPI0025AE6463|nr:SH2 domain-containing protein A-like isoform X2 [Malania oleifera]